MSRAKHEYHEEISRSSPGYLAAIANDATMAALYDNYVPRFKENQRTKPIPKQVSNDIAEPKGVAAH
jgi:hypothetical protein